MYNYNYYKEVAKDVRNYINENVNVADYDRDGLDEKLNDVLWAEDSVTGNGSGSYTFNYYKAMTYVVDNVDLLDEAAEALGIDDAEIGREFRNGDWETLDVTIRCYLLPQVITDVLDKMEIE